MAEGFRCGRFLQTYSVRFRNCVRGHSVRSLHPPYLLARVRAELLFPVQSLS